MSDAEDAPKTEAVVDPIVGRTFAGRYEVKKKLGEGGMGAVYLARQISVDRNVVLKVIHPQIAGTQQAAQRFRREMETSSRIEHPNTIQVYDFGRTDEGQLFLAIEFVEGRTLTSLLEAEGGLPLERCARIASQVARALGAANAEGIVHRDLKPDNVMLLDKYEQKDFVKVLDFGIAKFLDENKTQVTQDGGIIGTPNYMSPEQASGKHVDHRSDLYSLGVMLYQMATGILPFSGPTPISLILMHTTQPPPPPSEIVPGKVDPRLEQLILQLLAKRPDERPQTALEVVERLEAMAGGSAVLVPGTRIHEGSPPATAATRWILLGAGLIAVVAAGIAVPKIVKSSRAVDPARARLDALLLAEGEPAAPEKCRTTEPKLLAALAGAAGLMKSSPGQALSALEAGATAGDKAPEYWALLARAHLLTDHPAEAGGATEHGLALCPGYALLHNLAGNAAQKGRRLDDAQAAYARAKQAAPGWGTPRFNLGIVALRQKDPRGAIAIFDELLKQSPDHPNGYLTRGQAHLMAGHGDEAIADLEEATRRQPQSGDGWLLLGQARSAAKKDREAREAFCKAKALGVAAAAPLCP